MMDPAADRWAQGWRRLSLSLGMLIFPLLTVAGVVADSSGAARTAGIVLAVLFGVVYVITNAAAMYLLPLRLLRWGLVGMALLFLAELPLARDYAFFLSPMLVSFAAVGAGRYRRLLVGGAALAALVVPVLVVGWHTGPGWPQALAIVFTSMMAHAFYEIAATNRALSEARAEVARLAQEAERARIARDLHDLLGHSLTVITVKSGLARRLADSDVDRAVQEISEVETLSRQTLTEVRAAVSGYREVTLAAEIARGRELLRASGIAADLPTTTDMVAPNRQELFGWVLREGLTNVVRHAHATRCTVTLTGDRLEITDDGAGMLGAGDATEKGRQQVGGNGLAGLRERVTAVGGTVAAGPLEPHGWQLRVSL